MSINLKEILKTHPDAKKVVDDSGVVVQTRAVAKKKENDVNWYEEPFRYNLEYIPTHNDAIERIKEMTDPAIGGTRASWKREFSHGINTMRNLEAKERRLARLSQFVFVGTVMEIIPNVKYLDGDGNVFFEDVARLEISKKDDEVMDGISVYVYQHNFSSLQENEFENSIGQIFPVVIQSPMTAVKEIRENKLRNENENLKLGTATGDRYIAIGKISFAETVLHRFLLNKLELKEQNRKEGEPSTDELGDIVDAVIVRMTESGAWCVTNVGERIFVQMKNLSHKYGSRTYNYYKKFNPKELGDFFFKEYQQIQLKLTTVKLSKSTQKQRERGIVHDFYIIEGTALPFEKEPLDVLDSMIKRGPGNVYLGRIVDYNPTKGHLVEIEGVWKYPMRLRHSSGIREDDFLFGKRLSLRLVHAEMKTVKEKDRERYVKVTGLFELNTKMAPRSVTRFF